jgi:uracil-DNA glycosylase
MLRNVRVTLALGRIGFEAYCRAAKVGKAGFGHGLHYELGGGKTLVASYHPSRQNTNTGKLSWAMWIDIFRKVRLMLKN